MKRKLWLFFLFGFILCQHVFPQGRLVSGKIFDTNNEEPIVGATVLIKGTTIGTITDFNGAFSIEVPPENQILEVRYVGYNSKEINVANLNNIDIGLTLDIIGMDEVVVVGYGYVKRSDLTGSLTSIGSTELDKTKTANFLESMQGKVAGVQITSQSGEPGSNIEVRIRGANSINASSAPLYVIDGVQMDVNTQEVASARVASSSSMNPLSNLNPSDIESIEVLKDASATAIFGSRGANGVILITTKSGREGRTIYEYDTFFGSATASKKMKVLNGDEYLDYQRFLAPESHYFWEDTNDDGTLDSPRDISNVKHFNWQEEILRTALTQSHNFSLSGGTKNTRYSGSIGYLDQGGIIKGNEYQRYGARIRINHSENKIRTGFNLNSSYSVQSGASSASGGTDYNGIVQFILLSKPIDVSEPNMDWMTGGRFIHPTSMIDDAEKNIDIIRVIGNAFFNYQLMEGLSLQTEIGGNLSSSKGKEFYSKETSWGFVSNGKGVLQENRSSSWYHRDILTYDKRFGNHSLNLMAAFEINSYNFESFNMSMASFPDESTGVNDISKGSVMEYVNSLKWGTNRLSYLGRANYNYSDRYLITVSFRADGSDKFGPGSKFGYFPSAALAWRVNEEAFLKDNQTISNLKLRLSYGVTGNERIPAYSYFATMQNAYYASNGSLMLGLAPASRANPDLKWETTNQFNGGIDFGILDNRVSLTLDYFIKNTRDMLLLAPVSAQSGFSQQWKNIGSIDNEGLEFALMTYNIDKINFKWNTSFNLSTNRNTVVDLGDTDFIPVTIFGGWFQNVGRVIVGQPLGTAYGFVWDGVYQIADFTWQDNSDSSIPHEERNYSLKDGVVSVAGAAVRPGSFKFKDLNDDGVVDDLNDRQVISRSYPKHFGGINNSFTIKNFDLSFFFEWSYGNEVMNVSKIRSEGYQSWMNLDKDFWENRWTPENPTNKYGTISAHNVTSSMPSSYYVEDASYLRLKNIYLAYNIPAPALQKIGFSRLKIYFTATNLFTWTKYSGFDPEVNFNNPLLPGFDRITYPRAKTYNFGISTSF